MKFTRDVLDALKLKNQIDNEGGYVAEPSAVVYIYGRIDDDCTCVEPSFIITQIDKNNENVFYMALVHLPDCPNVEHGFAYVPPRARQE